MFNAIKKALHNLRRKRIAAAKEKAFHAGRVRKEYVSKREVARLHHVADVLEQRERGVRMEDGSLANMENRWVRKRLFKANALYPSQQKHPSKEGGIKVLGDA